MNAKEYIISIIEKGTPAQKKELCLFDNSFSDEEVLKKFKIFSKMHFIRYFKHKDAPFHHEMIENYIKSYRHGQNFINLAFRGSSKTSYAKLFLVFVILNDTDKTRSYIKILSKDIKNPKQIVTDVYNMMVELRPIYGNIFDDTSDKKREETMASFTTTNGVKLASSSVGQAQRGHVQDAYRPDWIIFDDIEDRESISSVPITEGIINQCDEALTGLAKNGSFVLLGNYISETGVVEWFLKKNANVMITPIEYDNKPTWDYYTPLDIERLKKESIDFYGEYMCDPSRTGDKYFDIDLIDRMLKQCTEPIRKVGKTKYWSQYIQHHRYGIGADTAEGVGRDSSALVLWNFRTGELVASCYSNEVKPELFGYELARVGTEFGECVIAPEINNMSGGIVITTLKNNYKNIYRQRDALSVVDKDSTKYGWHTNARTKPQMLMDFRKDFNDGLIKIHDRDLLIEMKRFTTNDMVYSTTVTRHFDLLMAACIGWQCKTEESNRTATVTYTGF